MGHLVHIVLALGAQALSEAGLRTGWRAPWAVLLLCVVPHLMASLSHRLFLRGRFVPSALVSRAVGMCSPALHLAALSLFGWESSLEGWLGGQISIAAWPRANLLAALLPFVAFELLSIDARSRITDPPGPARRSWRGFQLRMFLSGLLPLVAYVLVSAAAGASEDLRVRIEEVSLYGALFAAAMLALLALCLPTLLGRAWSTTPIGLGVQRDVLLEVAAKAGFRCRALLVWNTGDLMANAAIVGVGARHRLVLFSDLLLAQLGPRELAAVFAHEIGHAVRRHVRVFVIWAAGFFMAADLVANRLFADDPWLSGGFVLAAMAVWIWAFGFLSRRFELEADLYSLDLLGDAEALIGALERVGGRFRDVASWRHFSTAERVRFLERAAADPDVGRRLRRGLSRWARAGYVLFLAAGILQALSLAGSFAQDGIRADLRLGRYDSAVERAERAGSLDPGIAALVARARSLRGNRADPSDLERAARRAMRSGDSRAALEWLDLGGLRGRDDLALVADALREIVQGGDREAALPEELERAWGAEIEACRAGMRRAAGAPAAGADQ